MSVFVEKGRSLAKLLCIIVASLLANLARADAPEVTTDNSQEVQEGDVEEYAVLLSMFGVTQLVTYQKIGDDAFIGGDMLIGSHADIQRLSARNLMNALLNSDDAAFDDFSVPKDALQDALDVPGSEGGIPPSVRVWPTKRIPYLIEASVTDAQLRSNILAAIEIWNRLDIVAFEPALPGDLAVLRFEDGTGEDWLCYATLGFTSRVGGSITLNPPCTLGAVVHELAHSLGLMHEHQRPDRDQYLSVESFAVSDSNYAIGPVPSLATAYDLCSVVHYSPDQTPTFSPWFSLTALGEELLAACSSEMPNIASCRKVGQRCQPSIADISLLRQAYANSE